MSDKILQRIWMDKQPTTTTQTLLSITEDDNLEKLADVTNRIHTIENNRLIHFLRENHTHAHTDYPA